MGYAIQWIRSFIFIIQMYVAMAIIGIAYMPWALFSRKGAVTTCRHYCKYVCWSAGWMCGLKTEIRGEIPSGEVLVAAKHQSFLDIIMIYASLPSGKFIMKRELLWAPVLGQYAIKIGCVPVDRGKRGQAIKKMVADVEKGTSLPGQLIIYSQGTRVAPGVKKPYKVGASILYQQLGQDCIPAATNVGVFWPRHGIYRKKGTAVVEFLPRIEAGMSGPDFLKHLETKVEAASEALLIEAGFYEET
jgi:1-acyl-sn-glycerol-3-phosphate acyltransferase